MYFGLSDEQTMLKDMLKRFLADEFPLDVVRQRLSEGCADEQWQRTVDLGICGLLVPEEYGGSEVKLLDAQVVAEEMGAAVAPATVTKGEASAEVEALKVQVAKQQEQIEALLAQQLKGVGP